MGDSVMDSGSPTICVDLDGVLACWRPWRGVTKFGRPIPGAVEFTRTLANFARVVIYSCRGNLELGDGRDEAELRELMRKWLDKHGFAYDEIWTGQGKPIAVAYVDDRGVACRPEREDDPAAAFAEARKGIPVLVRPV